MQEVFRKASLLLQLLLVRVVLKTSKMVKLLLLAICAFAPVFLQAHVIHVVGEASILRGDFSCFTPLGSRALTLRGWRI